MAEPMEDSLRVEIAVLEKMGLRWAVLSAWALDLHNRGVDVGGGPKQILEATRIKLASGCFSTCEVGCDLGHVERVLVSADASAASSAVDSWLDLLGRCMAEEIDTAALLQVPAIHFHYAAVKIPPCHCDE